ncbi:MAG: family N-acetyltransferase [Flavipsychrobacter sp.]|jgi:RimJ/RimL family protein N-acetyltransferase|nr:family N-acetyltransferase [Flavipsychrobacter sp.]
MDIFPLLYTPRLQLRKIEVDDIPSLVKYAGNKKISDYVLNIPYPYNEPDAVFRISYVVQGFKNKARYVFAIILKETGEFIGEIGLHMDSNNGTAQLGYWVGERFWNKGIATEAVKKVLEFGFTKLELNRIFATCHVDNPASGKVLLNNGLKNKNTNGNVTQYVITKQEYEAVISQRII